MNRNPEKIPFYKGMVRPYSEAKKLGVLDKRVESLLDVMNNTGEIKTIGSCQGHGFPFIRVPPYISFSTTPEIAQRIKLILSMVNQKSKYQWHLSNNNNDDETIVYVIEIPSLTSGRIRHAIRYCLDSDISLIKKKFQKSFQHINRQNIEVKGSQAAH